MTDKATTDQRIYRGSGPAADAAARLDRLPDPPPWRAFARGGQASSARVFEPDAGLVKIVNAALVLRRPILLEGEPGSGKTTLAYAVAAELRLPGPFRWSITSRSNLTDGLYLYDALARLHDSNLPEGKARSEDVGRYLRLGPVGMAFAVTRPKRPAVLLIDEIDKSDIDLPSDLLHLFEEGSFAIPELERMETEAPVEVMPCVSSGASADAPRGGVTHQRVPVHRGRVACQGEFPLVFLTSNKGREFPAPFLRRCLRVLTRPVTGTEELLRLARAHLAGYDERIQGENPAVRALIQQFEKRGQDSIQSFDQLLNALVLQLKHTAEFGGEAGAAEGADGELLNALWASLGTRQKF